MKAKLLVVIVSVILIAVFSIVVSVLINLSFGKSFGLYNVLLAAAVCAPVISLFVGKNAYDFYREGVAGKKLKVGGR